MAIAKRIPTAEVAPQPAPVIVEKTTYQGIVVDHSDTPVESLVAYLDGMPWTVNYYGQLLGEHSDLRELDPGMNAAFQQYQKINELELRVNTPLTTDYDAENGITTVTGSAVIIHVVPNVNDYFIADAGSRELGLFRVRSVERRVFNRDSVYLIEYDMVGFARDHEMVVENLKNKVVRQYHFSKDRLVEGLSPVLREEDYAMSVDLSKSYLDTIHRYFSTFFNRSRMLLLVPSQTEVVYDAWLVDFLMQIIDSGEAEQVRDLKQVSLDHDRYMDQGSLWKVLLNRDFGEISRTHQKALLAPRGYFNRSSWIKGPIYWSVDQYVYPVVTEDKLAILGVNTPHYAGTPTFVQADARVEVSPYVEKNSYNTGTETIPLIKSVLIDDYYVLSEAFYSNQANLSVLEILVRDYLKCQTIDLKMLAALISQYPDWPVLERFYYGPLLILLMKDSIKGFYV